MDYTHETESYGTEIKMKQGFILIFNLGNFSYRCKIDLDHYYLGQEYYKKKI